MGAAVPVPRLFPADKAEVSLMNEGGRLEGLAGALAPELVRRQAAQLVVHERQELGGGPRVASGGGVQELRHVRHPVSVFRPCRIGTWVIDPRERAGAGKADILSGRNFGRG